MPGVGNASIFGARDYSMRIWIDPEKLANFDLSAQDVIAAVQSPEPAGRTPGASARPAVRPTSGCSSPSPPRDASSSAEEFGNIIVRAAGDGCVRARPRRRPRRDRGRSLRQHRRPTTASPRPHRRLPLARRQRRQRCRGGLEAPRGAEAPLPEGVAFAYVYNTADFVSAMIEKVIHTLVEAFALVAIVVFVFLGRFRPTLIPLIAVPVAIIGALAVLLAMGYSANTISCSPSCLPSASSSMTPSSSSRTSSASCTRSRI